MGCRSASSWVIFTCRQVHHPAGWAVQSTQGAPRVRAEADLVEVAEAQGSDCEWLCST
ncbi:MAG: hypothetical protein ACFNUE_01625 [Bacteroides sp.]